MDKPLERVELPNLKRLGMFSVMCFSNDRWLKRESGFARRLSVRFSSVGNGYAIETGAFWNRQWKGLVTGLI